MQTWHEVLIKTFKYKLVEVIPIIFQPVQIVDGDIVDELVDDFVRLGENIDVLLKWKKNQ